MINTSVAQRLKTASLLPPVKGILQRKCECGSHTVAGGACPECAKKRSGVKRKLSIGAINDPLEREADRVADQVLAAPVNLNTGSAQPHIQRATNQANGQVNTLPDSVDRVLSSPGRPLEPALKQNMEQRFAYNFSRVRVHSGAAAEQSARDVHAQAYTAGHNVVFGANRFSASTHQGRLLLAHELTHVIQQDTSSSNGGSQLQRRAGTPEPVAADGGLSGEMLAQIARRLHEAMAGLGTDEEAIYAAMAGRTQTQVDAIARVYAEIYGTPLIADLQDELTESEMRRLALSSPTVAPGAGGTAAEQARGLAEVVVNQLHEAMAGLGTDEDAIFAALTGRTEDEINRIKAVYLNQYGHDLEFALHDELSGDDLRRAFNLLDRVPEDMQVGFEVCTPGVRQELRGYWPIAQGHVISAITALNNGWAGLSPADKAVFRRYYDPSNSNTIDEAFVERVRSNFETISSYMQELTFDCDLDSGSICGDGHDFCTGKRLYWTCFGNIHVCPHFRRETDVRRKMSDIIHESTHNALHTTDREYHSGSHFNQLSPYGTGSLSVAQEIPVLGAAFRLIPGNDTLFNPDSYSHFAREM